MKRDREETKQDFVGMDNRQLLEAAIRRENLTPLELELILRLEAFIEIHGDYMTELWNVWELHLRVRSRRP